MNNFSNYGLIEKDFYKITGTSEHLIFCDECKLEWKWKDTVFFEEEYASKDKDKYFIIAFRCNQCGKEYLIAVNNGETLSEICELRRIEKRLAKLQRRAKGKPTPKQYSDIMETFEKRKKFIIKIGKHQEQLKEKFLTVKPDLILLGYSENKN